MSSGEIKSLLSSSLLLLLLLLFSYLQLSGIHRTDSTGLPSHCSPTTDRHRPDKRYITMERNIYPRDMERKIYPRERRDIATETISTREKISILLRQQYDTYLIFYAIGEPAKGIKPNLT